MSHDGKSAELNERCQSGLVLNETGKQEKFRLPIILVGPVCLENSNPRADYTRRAAGD